MAAQVEAPTTVNGSVLGKAEEYRTDGPGRVCIRDMVVTVKPGQAAYLAYAGIHNGTIRLIEGTRLADFRYGEIWKRPKRLGRRIDTRGGSVILRKPFEHKLAYLVAVPDADAEGQLKPRIWISGSLLTGGKDDITLLEQVSVGTAPTGCDRTYAFGWSMVFGEEPVSKDKQ